MKNIEIDLTPKISRHLLRLNKLKNINLSEKIIEFSKIEKFNQENVFCFYDENKEKQLSFFNYIDDFDGKVLLIDDNLYYSRFLLLEWVKITNSFPLLIICHPDDIKYWQSTLLIECKDKKVSIEEVDLFSDIIISTIDTLNIENLFRNLKIKQAIVDKYLVNHQNFIYRKTIINSIFSEVQKTSIILPITDNKLTSEKILSIVINNFLYNIFDFENYNNSDIINYMIYNFGIKFDDRNIKYKRKEIINNIFDLFGILITDKKFKEIINEEI